MHPDTPLIHPLQNFLLRSDDVVDTVVDGGEITGGDYAGDFDDGVGGAEAWSMERRTRERERKFWRESGRRAGGGGKEGVISEGWSIGIGESGRKMRGEGRWVEL